MLGFMYCILFLCCVDAYLKFCGGGWVQRVFWCQLMVQTCAADQPVGKQGSNVAQQSSGITQRFIYQI